MFLLLLLLLLLLLPHHNRHGQLSCMHALPLWHVQQG
jgi:hypothetical protein